MRSTCRQIEKLLMAVQDDFLRRPLQTLTVRQARQKYRASAAACRAILDALVDAGVLTRTPAGAYHRRFPGNARYAPSAHRHRAGCAA